MNWALINFLWQYGAFAVAVLVCGHAMRFGGRAERNAAILMLTGWTLSLVMQTHTQEGPGPYVELIDVIILIIWTWMSLTERRLWLIVMTASQLDCIVLHWTQAFAHFGLYPYAVAIGLMGGCGQWPILIWGTVESRLTKARATGWSKNADRQSKRASMAA